MATSDLSDPRCAPLCGAVRAYGDRALDPAWWWKHVGLCPMREHLRNLSERPETTNRAGESEGDLRSVIT